MTNKSVASRTGRSIERQCVTCRKLQPRDQLVRLVRTSADHVQTVQLDLRNACHGRGAYACRQRACLEKAVRKGGFARALKLQIPTDLVTRLIEEFLSQKEPSAALQEPLGPLDNH